MFLREMTEELERQTLSPYAALSADSRALTASGSTGDTAPYSQTVEVEGVTAEDNPIFVSLLEDGAPAETQKAYMKAFGIIASGTGTTAEGSVTFKVYKKPETDIIIGLKGV